MALSPTIHAAETTPETLPGEPGEALFLLPGNRGGVVDATRMTGAVEIVAATRLEDVPGALERVDAAVHRGLHAAGFVAYEAGAAFEPAIPHRVLEQLPYVWFALYEKEPERLLIPSTTVSTFPKLLPEWTRAEHADAIDAIRGWIAAGDTYQVNFTFPMTASFDGDAKAAFGQMAQSQQDAAFRSYLDTGTHRIASVSPELFFRLDGDRIVTRPMKGTAPRHPDPLLDSRCAESLRASTKERAENLMIVDLLRNDLGRIAETGSVEVERLFEVERYQTLWTMTSTVSARTRASLPEIFAALFPSGSVTGAPKIRTMQIIDTLEPEPRGVYCGAIGWWGPGRQAEFSVAIRTLVVDAERGMATYRVGSGITWDSQSGAEYDECLLKAAVLTQPKPDFDLLESLRLENGTFWLLERHLHRLHVSAEYFGFPFDESRVRGHLQRVAQLHPVGTFKARLLLAESGELDSTCGSLGPMRLWRVALAKRPISSQSPFVYTKTTHRAHYEAAVEGIAGVDDVILYNEQGELTESTRANLALELDGRWVTPHRAAGLLPGTFREELLATGALEERRITLDDLRKASRIRLINSVRGWIDVDLDDPPRS